MPVTGDEFVLVRAQVLNMVRPQYRDAANGFESFARKQGWVNGAGGTPASFDDAWAEIGWRQALRLWTESIYTTEHVAFLEADDRFQASPSLDAANQVFAQFVDMSAEQFVNVSQKLSTDVRAALDALAGEDAEWDQVETRGRGGAVHEAPAHLGHDVPPPPPYEHDDVPPPPPAGHEGVDDAHEVPPPPPHGHEGVYDPYEVPPPPPPGHEGVYDPYEVPPPPPEE